MITDDETKNFTSLNLDTLNSRKNDVDIFRQLINQEPSSDRSWSRMSTLLCKIRRLGKKKPHCSRKNEFQYLQID